MSPLKGTTVVLGLLLLGTAGSAPANTVVGARTFDRICGGSSFKTCYSAELVSKYNVTGQPRLVLRIRNLSGVVPGSTAGWAINGIGLDNVAGVTSLLAMAGPYRGDLPGDWNYWAAGSPLGAKTMAGDTWDVAALWTHTGNFITNTCDPNAPEGAWTNPIAGCDAVLNNNKNGSEWVHITFALSKPGGDWTGALTQAQLDAITMDVRFKDQETGQVFHCIDGQNCATVVPEPLTMLLLGTGLMGMGGAGLIRRRRQNGDVSDS